jgi:hypothetical protein
MDYLEVKLSPAILKNLYCTLVVAEPFCRWNMPLPEQIKFIVDADPDCMGTYLFTDDGDYEHVVTISEARCSFLMTTASTMAHEMIHMSRAGTITEAWSKHDATFKRRAKRVATELGFDPLEL